MSLQNIKVTGILACGFDFSIGLSSERGERLPWPIDGMSDDMRFFRSQTSGQCLLLGRKSAQAIGRLLPKRINLIFSKKNKVKIGNLTIEHMSHYSKLELRTLLEQPTTGLILHQWEELDALIAHGKQWQQNFPTKYFLGGGAQLLNTALKAGRLQDLYLTMLAHHPSVAYPQPAQLTDETTTYLPTAIQTWLNSNAEPKRQPVEQMSLIKTIEPNAENLYPAKIFYIKNLAARSF